MEDMKEIVLRNEEGNEVIFDIITKLDIAEEEYVIVVPKDDEEGDAIALRIDSDENGKDILVAVDDEDEFAMVCEAYEILFEE